MPARDLPAEVILLIIAHLDRPDTVRLLTVNRHWYNVVCEKLYRVVAISSARDMYAYRNLFKETRRRRRGDGLSTGFYSCENYGRFVKQLDLSYPYQGKRVTDDVLEDLTVDCTNLELLNLYNCFEVSTEALGRVLGRCPHLKHLYLALATRISGRRLVRDYSDRMQRLETLNVYCLGGFFHRSPVLPALKSLTMNTLTSTCYQPHLAPSLEHLKLIDLYCPKEVYRIVSHHRATLRSLQLKRCKITPHDLPTMLPPHLTTFELHICRWSCPLENNQLSSYLNYASMENLAFIKTPIPESELEAIVAQCSGRLRSFATSSGLTHTVLSTLVQRCPRITRLSLEMHENELTSLLPSLQKALETYQETLVCLHLGVQTDHVGDPWDDTQLCIPMCGLFQSWPNPRLEELFLDFFVCDGLVRQLPQLYPSLRILRVGTPSLLATAMVVQGQFHNLVAYRNPMDEWDIEIDRDLVDTFQYHVTQWEIW